MNKKEYLKYINDNKKFLMAFAFKLTQNTADRDDLYQETCALVFKGRDKFGGNKNFKSWASTIMYNKFVNGYRKRKKMPIVDLDAVFSKAAQTVSADSKIAYDDLNVMVSNLDDDSRVPFQMHVEGYQYNEIAEKLQVPLGTVKSRIYYARQELIKQINRVNTVPNLDQHTL